MAPNLFLFFVIAIAAASVAVGVARNRTFRRKELLHQRLARQLGIKVAYQSERDFDLFGTYQGYPLRIEAVTLHPDRPGASPLLVVKASMPMVNPNLKSLRIAREQEEFPRLNRYRKLDRPIHLDHGIAPWLEITTNDPMFSGLILSEDVKISLFEAFNPLETGLVYLQDEELSFMMPYLLITEERVNQCIRMVDLLVEIKNQLN